MDRKSDQSGDYQGSYTHFCDFDSLGLSYTMGRPYKEGAPNNEISVFSFLRWTKYDVFIHIISFAKTAKNGNILFSIGNFIHENLMCEK